MKRQTLYSTLFNLLLVSNLFPQQHINFNHLTVEDGLSQSSVTCIFQDQKGFMWFGTQDGLNRFDGYNFKIFKNIPSDPKSLTENFVFSIYEQPSGDLYIETQSGAFHKYNPREESFQIVPKDTTGFLMARISTVGALLQESSGVIWSGGLGNGTGLKRTDTKTAKTTIFKHNPKDPKSISHDKVYSVFRDKSGDLWVGTFNGLDKLDESTGNFIHYRHNPNDPNSLPDNWVWSINEDSHRFLWIGTQKGGLSRFDPKTRTFVNFKNDPNDPTTINNNFIFSIFEDRSSMIWVGTNLGGVNYFHPSANAFEHYSNDPENKNSLNDDLIASMIVDRNGIYWIGTSNGGLNKFDHKKNIFTPYRHSPKIKNSLSSNAIQSLLEDRSGLLWIGTYSNGLNTYDRRTGKFEHYIHNPSVPSSLSDNRIYALEEDKTGDIWIGTYGGGLNKFEKKSGAFFHYQNNEQDPRSLSSNATWSLAQDGSGILWIGTFGGGINVFDEERQIFRHYKNNPDDSTSIISDNIIRVVKDSNDNMWFGSVKGLSRYSRDADSFINYDERDGLANSFVYGIVEDNQGNLWLSTNNGLSRFNPSTEVFSNYFVKDGLQGNEFNQNAYAKDKKTGNILFGGPNGFNIFNPDNLKENSYVPPIEFSEYLRYNTDDEEGKPILEKGISEIDSIRLTYKDNIITLNFAALSYYNNLENQYRYKLEGFNENWIQLGNNHSVTFTNLSSGEYDLKVMGSNNDGLWNEEGASLKLLVSPPWWKTKTAYFLYFIAFFTLLYSVRRVEIKRREQKAQIRESALRIKATEAEKRTLEVENERKSKELEEARQLQISMLPKELPDLPDLEIAAFMRTATEVGGDYYDFIVQEDGVLNVAFGDATGHGLQAGTMVTLMKGFFTSDSTKFGLQDFMSHCTKVIKEIKLGRILMSFSYLKIKDNHLQITSCGMPPLYYHQNDTGELEEISIQGTPLGAMKNAKYKIEERKLKSGDTLLLLTDGLPEQMNNEDEMFDYTRVTEHFTKIINYSPDEIIKKLVEAGDKWMNGRMQDDDITFVVIRVK